MLGIRNPTWIAVAVAFGALSLSLAIAFDDYQLTAYQLEMAKLLISIAGGMGVIFSALRYVWERQKELAWQKTTFMVGLFKDFEHDPVLRRAQELVDLARYDSSRLKAALRPMDMLYREAGVRAWPRRAAANSSAEALADRLALDRYLDFFDHLYTYIYITKTLDAADVTSFSGYAIDVLDSELLSKFAFDWGYEDVLRLAIHFIELAEDEGRPRMVDQLRKTVASLRPPR